MHRTFTMAGLAFSLHVFAPTSHALEPAEEAVCTTSVAHGPNRAPAQSTPATACRYDTGLVDQSPSIQVTKEGVVFVGKSAGGVIRSTDGGRSWQDIPVPPHANGDDHTKGIHGYVHVDPAINRVYYITSMSAASCGGSKGAVISWSDDLGATWSGSTAGCDTYDWGRLVTGFHPKGEKQRAVYFLGVSQRIVGGTRLAYRSLDGGKSWQLTKNPASVTTEAGAGATASDGTIYFDYPEFIGFDLKRVFSKLYPFKLANLCREMIAVSEDFGDTWRQEAIPGSRACNSLYGQQRVAVDKAGTVYAVWTDDKDGQAYLAVSRDKARTWSIPINVMPNAATFNNSFVNVAAGKAGHIVIAAMNTQETTNPRKGILQGQGVWHSYMTESFNASAASPVFRSFNLDTTGDPSLANGESPTEAEAYLGMSPSDKTWAVFARHGGKGSARIHAAHIED